MLYLLREDVMARTKSLSTMSIEALVELRDSITEALSDRSENLRAQLMRLGGSEASDGKRRGRPPSRKSALRGRKVAPKYRSKKNPKLTWAGRGATPRWMKAEMKA